MAEEPGKLDITDEMIAERRGGSGPMPKDMSKWMAATITKIEQSITPFKLKPNTAGSINSANI